MAYEFLIPPTEDGWLSFVSQMTDIRDGSDNTLKVKVTSTGKRSLSQNAFQHVIYQEISKYLISKGRSEWTPEFTKKNLKNKFLGWVDDEFIDVKTGCKSVQSVLRSTSKLDKGESFHFTTAILDWAESIGCFIKIPESCEYRQLQEQQNGQ
jgi:hypothetical protein